MRVATALTALVGAVAGVAVGLVAYQGGAALPAPASESSSVTADQTAVPSPPPVVRTRFADCTPPARLVKGVCVTHVERTVVVRDPAGSTAGGSSAAGDNRYASTYGEPRQQGGDDYASEDDAEHGDEPGEEQDDGPGAEHEPEDD